MNSVQLVGRLVKDPEVRYSQGEKSTAIARFTVACDRKFKQEGQPTADFINCVCFGKPAEIIEKYFTKGMRIGVTGRIQTGSYKNKDGNTVYTTDIACDGIEFVESKANSQAAPTQNAQPQSAPQQNAPQNPIQNIPGMISGDGFMNIPSGFDTLPFN